MLLLIYVFLLVSNKSQNGLSYFLCLLTPSNDSRERILKRFSRIKCRVLKLMNVRRKICEILSFMMFEEKWRFENHYLKAVIVNRKRVAKRNLKAQGYNVRKVISELYASFVLQCTVSGRQCKHKTDVTAWHGIHLSHKKSMKYSGLRKLICELSKLSKLNAFNILGY